MVSSSPAFSAGHDGSGVLANHDREIGDNRDIDDSLGRPGRHIALRVSWKTNDSTRALALTIAEVRPYAASMSSNRINICNRVARKEKLRCDNKDFRCRGQSVVFASLVLLLTILGNRQTCALCHATKVKRGVIRRVAELHKSTS